MAGNVSHAKTYNRDRNNATNPMGLAINPEVKSFFIDGKIIKSEKDLDLLMQRGMDGFKRELVSRIWVNYDGDLGLNCCPQCGKVARTPWAKQCRFCFYKWHNK
jgi:hypothetical protein